MSIGPVCLVLSILVICKLISVTSVLFVFVHSSWIQIANLIHGLLLKGLKT